MIPSVPLSVNLVNRSLPWVTLVAILDEEGGTLKVEEKTLYLEGATMGSQSYYW